MMNSQVRTLRLIALLMVGAALIGAAVIFLTMGRTGDSPPERLPPEVSARQPEAALELLAESEKRSPVEPVQAEPASIKASIEAGTVLQALPEAIGEVKQEFIANRAEWPAEYEKKSVAELRIDEARLRAESKTELEAEVERRFADGRYLILRREEYNSEEPNVGVLAMRGDEHSVRIVSLDPRIEPDLFIKERKATWLHEQILIRNKN